MTPDDDPWGQATGSGEPVTPAPPSASERTVVASPEAIAAAMAEADARAAAREATSFVAPPADEAPSFEALPFEDTTSIHQPRALDEATNFVPLPEAVVEAAIEALPPARAAPPAVPSFGHGPPGGLVGYQLNDLFEIVRFIARGGMGEVYEGRNLASGERVAIKVILPQFAADDQFMSLFRREASSLERLGHDALVKYRTLAFDRTSQLNYLAIEFVDGVPMSDVLSGQPADSATIRVVLRRLASGLGAAHQCGVVHRDLSPDNILLPDGDVARAKIIDFGIAKDTNPGEKSVVGDAFAGKFGYAAPEIFGKYKRSVGPWTDVYSLALTVLAFANGKPLDMGITIVDALEARDTVPNLSFLPPDLIGVFTGMLQPDPEARFRSMEAVVEALDAPAVDVFGDQQRTAFQPSTSMSPPSPAFVRADTVAPVTAKPRSKVPLFGGIAAAVLVVLGGGGYFAMSGGSRPTERVDTSARSTVDATVVAATPPAVIKAEWSSARSQLLAALAAVPCSDLRLSGEPSSDGRVQVIGWHPSGTSLPAAPTGYSLDGSKAASVPTPSSETCSTIRQLRAAVPSGDESGFTMVANQRAKSKMVDGKLNGEADLGIGQPPAGLDAMMYASIADRPIGKESRIDSQTVTRSQLEPAGFVADQPQRYLIVLAVGKKAPPSISWPLDTSKLAAACAGGNCALVSGWVDLPTP